MTKKAEITLGIIISITVLAFVVFGLSQISRQFNTFEPPEWYPEVEVTVYEPDLMQPGLTVFGPNMMDKQNNSDAPAYFGYDETGELVWYYPDLENDIFSNCDLELMPDGNYLIHIDNGWRVITPKGKTVMQVTADDLGLENIHHDVTFTPQGTYIAIANETRNMSVDWLTGDRVAPIKGELLVEVGADGKEIWRWNAFDHLDVNRVALEQTKIDKSLDWLHANGLQYFEDDDSILLSLRSQSWVIKIDHATGEVVWRLGRDGDFELLNGDPANKIAWFSAQHAPELHSDGTILIYDNGNERAWTNEQFSRAVMYQLDEDTMTARQIWQYQTDYFTDFVGDVDLLENGNILVTAGGQRNNPGPAQIIEVTSDIPAVEVWKMEIPGYDIFRATRF
ncbi:MAG: aryl-sulfate sulfotransferase [Candidatus Uhrbacteria bacterium]